MATPQFILDLREKIGTVPLWLCGVTAVVVRGDDVLLVRRADTGEWSPVCGIIDPGEDPSDAATREVLEEADVVATAEHLSWVHVTDMYTYDNGDRTQYVDIVFRLQWVSGEPFPADGENTEAGWFVRTALPEMSTDMRRRVDTALDGTVAARFGPLDD
ncbi:NUDIX hydrolase [Aeromicrobium fastidiosum]|uniref:NUDIX domain-containing protein n=1 Tax=Aeromicrobium fastidiosum TaxID=52699 RepID=A0A641AQ29_9ACTN|nr:NUDIX domain-containing protein [Aeromicrobium fastidiosum]KAA1380039.1 NUDIX domain-containing protein [Aeromicrobium fastidiosum]MBP2389564.1 ADP-ribose pyrophosphatase YjhB (NUDIX family) [Aeromicrobium fastidiosum]